MRLFVLLLGLSDTVTKLEVLESIKSIKVRSIRIFEDLCLLTIKFNNAHNVKITSSEF